MYTGILTDALINVFNKAIEKDIIEDLQLQGYKTERVTMSLKSLIKALENGEYKYFYNVEDDTFYEVEDLKELL
jgi:predicted RNA-binding protein with EMAP domain